jgi:membrane-bound lytic murein transglycosylase A
MPTRVLLLALLVLVLAGCSSSDEAQEAPEATLTLQPVEVRAVDGWRPEGMAAALRAFQTSCTALAERPPGAPMVPDRPAFGTTRDWMPACEHAQSMTGPSQPEPTDAEAQRFFRQFFRPHRVAMGTDRRGLFTGYYEPELRGARERSSTFSEPLHRPPQDLIRVNLGDFRSSLDGEQVFGRVDGRRLVPYYDRERIAEGVLDDDLAIAYVDSRVDKFFLQIQGSGRVVLRDSSMIRVGYAAANGQPYRAIGRDLIRMGEVLREEMSMQAIRQWLAEHPDRADDLMNRNRSYVFFQERTDLDPREGPIGAQGVPLTAGHSLAVDHRYLPYGAPLWLSTHRPLTDAEVRNGTVPADTVEGEPVARMRRMMIAQDTGGAIRGAVRGDVFWGSGDRAASIAGRMQSPGTYVVFLPATIAN